MANIKCVVIDSNTFIGEYTHGVSLKQAAICSIQAGEDGHPQIGVGAISPYMDMMEDLEFDAETLKRKLIVFNPEASVLSTYKAFLENVALARKPPEAGEAKKPAKVVPLNS